MKKLFTCLVLSAFFLGPWPGSATLIENYDFPYKDPVLATVTNGLLQPFMNQAQSRKVPGFRERDRVPLLGARNFLGYSLYQQPAEAPLVVIVPGLCASEHSSQTRYIGELLYRQGYHVIGLPSPFYWRFVLSSGHFGMPGVFTQDIADLEEALNRVIQDAVDQHGLHFDEKLLLGFSMGALQVAHLGAYQAQQSRSEWQRIVMVNPPIDIIHGIKALDELEQVARDWDENKKNAVSTQVIGELMLYVLSHQVDDPEYFLNLDQKLSLPRPYLRYAMSLFFRHQLTFTVHTTQQIEDQGLFRNSNVYDWQRRQEARQYNYEAYVHTFLLPFWQGISSSPVELLELQQQSGLAAVEAFLRQAPEVFLFHNSDDFLLRPGDVEWLEQVFKERAFIYPHGGHLGNLWHQPYQKNLLAVLGQGEGTVKANK